MQVQLFLTLLLVLLFWFLSEGLEDRAVFGWWTAGWSAVLVELILGGLYLSGTVGGFWGSVLFFAIPVVGILHVAFFALGGRRLQRQTAIPRRRVVRALAAAAAVGAVAGVVAVVHEADGTLGMAYQMAPRNLGLAVVYPFCAFAFYRSSRFDAGLSAVLIVLGFSLYGADQLVYGLAAAREVADHLLGLGGPGPGVEVMLTDWAFVADVVWEATIGAGTVLLLRKEERRARRVLTESEERYRKLFEDSVDGIFLADTSLRIADMNRSLRQMLGWGDEKLPELTLGDLLASDAQDELPDLEAVKQGQGINVETSFASRDGTVFPVEVSLSFYDLEDREALQGIVRDITARKALEDRLARQALHHPLTGLPNRYRFRQELEAALARMRRSGEPFGLLFLDVDGLKEVNDTLGHPAGDELLRAVGRRLRGVSRDADTAAHLGGDEFTVLLHGCGTREELRRAGGRVLSSVEGSCGVDGDRVEVRVSVGGALAAAEDAPDDVLTRADDAMYRAKAAGGDDVIAVATRMAGEE